PGDFANAVDGPEHVAEPVVAGTRGADQRDSQRLGRGVGHPCHLRLAERFGLGERPTGYPTAPAPRKGNPCARAIHGACRMNSPPLRVACLAAGLGLLVFAVAAARDEPVFDFHQQQSPPKPTPEGMKFIDQGRFDPRLNGYVTPEGFKLEVVAEEPVTV